MAEKFRQTYFKKHIALPGEHGAWVFILSPLLIGLFAGGRWGLSSIYLIAASMAAFFIRQPVTMAVKAFSGRRPKKDLPAVWFWMAVYALIGALALAGLVSRGLAFLLILALPGVPVFIWYLWLVSRRAERRQVGMEVVGSGVLALAAPAALWAATGEAVVQGWWLFGLCWLQSAASIVYAYLRLEQRQLYPATLPAIPPIRARLGMARRALLYTSFNFILVLAFSLQGTLPAWLPLPYLLQWAESVYGAFRPAVGVKPTHIGFRQLAVSSLFTLMFILTWR